LTKEELSKLKKIKSEIEQIKRELNNVEPEYTKDSVKGSSPNFPYTEHSIKIQGYDYDSYCRKAQRIQNRLNRKLEELIDEKDRINEYIYNLDDSDIRQILSYRYINGLTWEQIGANMNYAAVTVRMKHDEFMKSISPNITLNDL
jgi:DNA-directed RNA polymerase specialized sigma subunit